MSAAETADTERRELAELLVRLGPDHPTLCGDWTTRDLVAHLVVRETRPDAAPGILLPPLAGYTKRVQDRTARRDFADLVDEIRSGPPIWSPLALPPLRTVDVQEYFVHHEDVRRAEQDWSPRPPAEERDRILWRQCGLMGRISYRRSPVGIVQRRPDGAEHVVHHGGRRVVITGEPGELLLHAVGRDECRVHLDGEPADVAAIAGLDRGL
jgi:uncharacterized protein (TIGR03085 family)